MSNIGQERKDKEDRLGRLWRGLIDRAAYFGITIEFKYNSFMENYALHGSFIGRQDNDAILYSFMQEINTEEGEDVDKIEYLIDLVHSARVLNLQSPMYIPGDNTDAG